MSFSFSAVNNETHPGELEGHSMDVVTSWDSSTYDPNSFEEQTIYGEVNRAELEKYFTIPENADLRAVRKVQLQPDHHQAEADRSARCFPQQAQLQRLVHRKERRHKDHDGYRVLANTTVYAHWTHTGDSGQMNLWSTALCASFAGCVALIVWRIRRREKKSL